MIKFGTRTMWPYNLARSRLFYSFPFHHFGSDEKQVHFVSVKAERPQPSITSQCNVGQGGQTHICGRGQLCVWRVVVVVGALHDDNDDADVTPYIRRPDFIALGLNTHL